MNEIAVPMPGTNFGPVIKIGTISLALELLLLMVFSATGGATTTSNSKRVFTVVIADDEPDNLAATTVAMTAVIKAIGYEPKILPSVTLIDTIKLAMTGNDGKKVNAVVLDGGYALATDINAWAIRGSKGEIVDWAEGPVIAEQLRLAGYDGPIILASGAPSDYSSPHFAAKVRKYELWSSPTRFVETFRPIFK